MRRGIKEEGEGDDEDGVQATLPKAANPPPECVGEARDMRVRAWRWWGESEGAHARALAAAAAARSTAGRDLGSWHHARTRVRGSACGRAPPTC